MEDGGVPEKSKENLKLSNDAVLLMFFALLPVIFFKLLRKIMKKTHVVAERTK
jgi:hypothetical protein